jgi:hypothetical protein
MQIKKEAITREMIEKALTCENPKDLVALAGKEGYEMTETEAEAYLDELADFKLDSEALKKVAGGGCYSRHTGGEWECKKYCNNRCKDKDISY